MDRVMEYHAPHILRDAILHSSKTPEEDEDGWKTVRRLSSTYAPWRGFCLRSHPFWWSPLKDWSVSCVKSVPSLTVHPSSVI